MAPFKLAALALLAFNSMFAFADSGEAIIESVEELPDDDQATSPGSGSPLTGLLKVVAQVSFPDSDVFGVKLVNGHPSTATFQLLNSEEDTVTVRVVGGSLWSLERPPDVTNLSGAVRNLTSVIYNVEVPAKSNITFDYQFSTEMHPQNLRLLLAAIVENTKGVTFQVEGFNGTVSVVEAPISIFDPQMLFLYAFLATLLAGTVYFIYSTWLKAFFPQPKRSRRPGTSARKSTGPGTTTTSSANLSDSATTTGAEKSYDESWIPAQHLQRPEAKRVRSGTPKTRAK